MVHLLWRISLLFKVLVVNNDIDCTSDREYQIDRRQNPHITSPPLIHKLRSHNRGLHPRW